MNRNMLEACGVSSDMSIACMGMEEQPEFRSILDGTLRKIAERKIAVQPIVFPKEVETTGAVGRSNMPTCLEGNTWL